MFATVQVNPNPTASTLDFKSQALSMLSLETKFLTEALHRSLKFGLVVLVFGFVAPQPLVIPGTLLRGFGSSTGICHRKSSYGSFRKLGSPAASRTTRGTSS